MYMHIEVKSSTSSNHRQGNNGKTYGEQQAALHDGGDYPIPFKLNRERGQELQPGMYRFARGSFGNDKFGNLVIGRMGLEPVPATSAKA